MEEVKTQGRGGDIGRGGLGGGIGRDRGGVGGRGGRRLRGHGVDMRRGGFG